MTTKINTFKDLKIWQAGINIVKDTYCLTGKFPKDELYGLVSQMRRSAISIPANIAEGFKRLHNKEFRQFLYISLGSSAELETHLILSQELGYISKEESQLLNNKIISLSKMITVLIKRLV